MCIIVLSLILWLWVIMLLSNNFGQTAFYFLFSFSVVLMRLLLLCGMVDEQESFSLSLWLGVLWFVYILVIFSEPEKLDSSLLYFFPQKLQRRLGIRKLTLALKYSLLSLQRPCWKEYPSYLFCWLESIEKIQPLSCS